MSSSSAVRWGTARDGKNKVVNELVLKVGAACCWLLAGIALHLNRPDLAQPLAMLGTALVNILNDKNGPGKSPVPTNQGRHPSRTPPQLFQADC
jgi:hypothetical protein